MVQDKSIETNNEVLIKVEGLSKKFCKDLKTSLKYGVLDLVANIRGNKNVRELRDKEFWAVKDINFELRRGECLGLIGHNGAGKSTLLKILNGLIKPDAGKVTIKGRVGALIELGAGFNPILSGRENIYNNGAILGFTKKEIDSKAEAIIDFAEIREFIDMPVQHYSSGMKVRLGFAVAAQLEPDVLIIDEVLAVGDVAFRMKCYKRIIELIENTAVIFVSHSLSQVSRVCTSGLMMQEGELKFIGSLAKTVTLYEKEYLNSKIKIIDNKDNSGMESFIKSVTLFDEKGLNKNEFDTGDNICVSIVLFSKKLIKGSRIRICLESVNIGPLGGFSSPLSNVFVELLPNTEKELKVIIKNIPLQVGSYNVIVGWYDEGEEQVIDVKNFGTYLNIVGPEIKMLAYGSDGLILFEHEWVKF